MIRHVFSLLALIALAHGDALPARENDPFTRRQFYEPTLPDFKTPLNEQTNRLLDLAVAAFNQQHCGKGLTQRRVHHEFAFYVYYYTAAEYKQQVKTKVPKVINLGYALNKKGLGPLQRWVREQADRKYIVSVTKNIYSNMHMLPERYFLTFSVLIDDVFVGPDKVDHFFDQGYAYWQVSRYGKNLKQALNHGVSGENGYFGLKASGVFSFADLRANYMGYLFYKDMFDLEIPLFSVTEKGCLTKERPFDWKNWIDWQWDELLNPSYYKPTLFKKIRKHLVSNMKHHKYCESYFFNLDRGAYDYVDQRTSEYYNGKVPKSFKNIFDIGDLCLPSSLLSPEP